MGTTGAVMQVEPNSHGSGASVVSIPPARVFCAFSDGGVGLYNMQTSRFEMLRDQVNNNM